MATEWGRSRTGTVIWPPHTAVFTITAAVIAGFVAAFGLVILFLSQEPLQKYYTPAYIESSFPSVSTRGGMHKYQLLYVADARGHIRLASAADVINGRTKQITGHAVRVAASPAAVAHGWISVVQGVPVQYKDQSVQTWLRATVFAGASPWTIFKRSGELGFLAFLLQLPVSIPSDIKRRKTLKYGRRLKGPVLLTPKGFIKAVQGDGIGFQTTEAKERMCIPRAKEAQHIELIGDTGTGKSSLIRQILMQVRDRGEIAIVYDPACEYIQQFFNAERGDIVLNPLDSRCPYWSPSDELRTAAEADAIAESLYQPLGEERRDEFFVQTPAQIFAHLLKYKPTPAQLVEWMSNPKAIERRVKGTEFAQFIAKAAGPQRVGVLSSLGLKAKSFRLLPTPAEAEGVTWTASDWAARRDGGWIFITSRPTERDALKPLISLWIDLLVMRLLTAPEQGQKPVWFVIDELASLQKLPKLHMAITENRKSGNPIVLGFQGKAQLEVIYGHLAEVMMSQPATKVFLKTTEPKAAEWVSKAIGSIEVERLKETKMDGSRTGKSFTVDRQVDPLVMESEITGLDDLHAFMKLGNEVARFSFQYISLPKDTPGFTRRAGTGAESFCPLVLGPDSEEDEEEEDEVSEESRDAATEGSIVAPARAL